jgi:outer membrane protein assembly factor BamB
MFPKRYLILTLAMPLFLAACAAFWLWRAPATLRAPVVRLAWAFEPRERGAILSTPTVAGGQVYFGAIQDAGLASYGAVYCLHLGTGKVVWKFDDAGVMQHMYSSPCLDQGRLYIGEGMHHNFVCKLYCIDAATGSKLWDFVTGGHIESTPCSSDDCVYFGAGDDGVYCLESKTGKKRWQFKGGFHIDSNPMVENSRLYVGSGVSETCKETRAFCLDAKTGQVVWSHPTELPVWGSPAVDSGQVYFGLGNGSLTESAKAPENPAGAMICLDAGTGQVIWRQDFAEAVFARCTINGEHLYFGSRDGLMRCLERRAGSLVWARPLGGPIMTSVVLRKGRLYVLPEHGPACCLDSANGNMIWQFDIAALTHTQPQLYSSPILVEDELHGAESPLILFGAELKNAVSSAATLYCLREAEHSN